MIETPAQLAPVAEAAKPSDGLVAKTSSSDFGQAKASAATRVYVDQDGSGVFVYRLVDVATGRVLVELPRERADELKASPDYEAGALLSTSA